MEKIIKRTIGSYLLYLIYAEEHIKVDIKLALAVHLTIGLLPFKVIKTMLTIPKDELPDKIIEVFSESLAQLSNIQKDSSVKLKEKYLKFAHQLLNIKSKNNNISKISSEFLANLPKEAMPQA